MGYRVRKYLWGPVASAVYGLVAPGTSVYGPVTSGADCRMPHFHSTVTVRFIVSPGSVQQSLTRTSSRLTKLKAGSSIVENISVVLVEEATKLNSFRSQAMLELAVDVLNPCASPATVAVSEAVPLRPRSFEVPMAKLTRYDWPGTVAKVCWMPPPTALAGARSTK